jgi:hypothetical protein
MRRAERLVHVRVRELAELSDEGGIIAGLTRTEAEVLEQDDLAWRKTLHLPGDVGADHRVRSERHGDAEELAQALGDRGHRELRIRRTVRAPEVAARNHGRAALEESFDRRCCRRDAQVVADCATLYRHVEVCPYEYPRALCDRQVLESRQRRPGHDGAVTVSRRTRPGRSAGSRTPTRCRTSRAP